MVFYPWDLSKFISFHVNKISSVFFIFSFFGTNSHSILYCVFFKSTAGNSYIPEHVKTPVYPARVGFEDISALVCVCPIMHCWHIRTWAEGHLFPKATMGITSKAIS